jgi:hypothetical protein
MDGKGNADNNTDLALTGLSNLAKLIGITFSPAKVITIPASAIAIIVDNIKGHRTKKHIEKLEKLIQCLGHRLTQLECKLLESPDIDLFNEIVAKAVSDEDEDKTELYAALVQYWMEHKSQLASYEVRLLGNAIKELTVDEIAAFHDFFISGQVYPTKKMPKQLQEVFWNRVLFLGLLGGIGHIDMKSPSFVTQFGKMLVKIYVLSITTE